jgi:hypothetical protein
MVARRGWRLDLEVCAREEAGDQEGTRDCVHLSGDQLIEE